MPILLLPLFLLPNVYPKGSLWGINISKNAAVVVHPLTAMWVIAFMPGVFMRRQSVPAGSNASALRPPVPSGASRFHAPCVASMSQSRTSRARLQCSALSAFLRHFVHCARIVFGLGFADSRQRIDLRSDDAFLRRGRGTGGRPRGRAVAEQVLSLTSYPSTAGELTASRFPTAKVQKKSDTCKQIPDFDMR